MQQAMTPSTILRTSWRYALVCGLLALAFAFLVLVFSL